MANLQNYQAAKDKNIKKVLTRISSICDEGSFVQSLSYLSTGTLAEEIQNNIVCGFGKVNGQNVGVIAQNFDNANGSIDLISINKAVELVEKATRSGMPLVFLFDSAGLNLDYGVLAMDSYGKLMQAVVKSSGVVPMLGLVMGPCVGIQGILAQSMDFLITCNKDAQIGSYSNYVLESCGNYDEKRGFSNKGVQFNFEEEAKGFETLKKILSYLPSNNLQKPIQMESIPANTVGMGIEGLMQGTFDAESIFDIYNSEYYRISLARLEGRTVGAIYVADKGICIGLANKVARFVQTANCFNIPIISFVNSNGILLDTDQEERGVLRAASRMAFAYGQSVVPMISVVMNIAIGAGYTLLASKGIGNDFVYALDGAIISAVDLDAAIRIHYSDEMANVEDPQKVQRELKQKYIETKANAIEAVKQGVIDDILMPSDVRAKLSSALGVVSSKRVSGLPKKHSNMPL